MITDTTITDLNETERSAESARNRNETSQQKKSKPIEKCLKIQGTFIWPEMENTATIGEGTFKLTDKKFDYTEAKTHPKVKKNPSKLLGTKWDGTYCITNKTNIAGNCNVKLIGKWSFEANGSSTNKYYGYVKLTRDDSLFGMSFQALRKLRSEFIARPTKITVDDFGDEMSEEVREKAIVTRSDKFMCDYFGPVDYAQE